MQIILSFLIALLLAPSVYAAPFFTDGFESGDSTHTDGGVTWGDGAVVSTANPRTGSYSLRFAFQPKIDGEDNFIEKRFYLTTPLQEFWVRMYVYIPLNFKHRDQISGGTNNKMLLVYSNPYSSGYLSGINFLRVSDSQSSLMVINFNNGEEAGYLSPSDSFITAADKGTWMEVIYHCKVSTSGSSGDGVIQVWKNGSLIADYTNLNTYGLSETNYINEGYLMGWQNSGYEEETIFYIDDVEFSGTAIQSNPDPDPTPTTTGPIPSFGGRMLSTGGRILVFQ
jgi:hypothetical protein